MRETQTAPADRIHDTTPFLLFGFGKSEGFKASCTGFRLTALNVTSQHDNTNTIKKPFPQL